MANEFINTQQSDIAVVGVSALFAGAADHQTYWQNILQGVCHIREAPESWTSCYFDPDSSAFNRIYTRRVGLLGDLARFNPLEFGVLPTSVDGSEPDHFLALKLAKAALKDAGYAQDLSIHKKTGIILGRGATPNRGSIAGYQYGVAVDQILEILQKLIPDLSSVDQILVRQSLEESLPKYSTETLPGLVSNVAVGRIANRLNFQGPSYMIDAACSSSLIAVEVAMKELRNGRCDLMLAGGIQASMPPQIYMLFGALGALSREELKPFDGAASGTLLGEGVGFLALRRLADAQRDGDRIYAVLKQVGLSSDGKAMGLLAPRLDGEVLALERAYQESGISPQSVGLIEAHGTGIPLGDLTEIKALSQIFGQRGDQMPHCGIGSVKSMIGHCIPAAGIASLIKTCLALYHKVLPPTLCNRINPNLALEQTPFYVNTVARPWIHGYSDHPRRAAVNAFGFGGINAHAIVEEYAEQPMGPLLHTHWPEELCLFTAASRAELLAQVQALQAYLQRTTDIVLANLAYTLATMPLNRERLVVIAKNPVDLAKKLDQAVKKLAAPDCQSFKTRQGIYYSGDCHDSTTAVRDRPPAKIAFLFPGEGSQYPNMLADLCLHFPAVRLWFDRSDQTFREIWSHPPSTFIFPPPTALTEAEQSYLAQGLYDIDVATEAMFTADMALFELLQAFGITADLMAGHSTGEYAALAASGAIRTTDPTAMMELKRTLNQLYKEFETTDVVPRGNLLALGAVPVGFVETLLKEFAGRIHLAMDNCPNQKIIFVESADLPQIRERIKAVGGIYQQLPFDRAYHTPLFGEMGQRLEKYYQQLPIQPCQTPLYSCATADQFPQSPEEMRQLAAQQWSTTVQFQRLIETLYEAGTRIFIEVGPSNNLTTFVNNILRQQDYLSIASNTQHKSGMEQLLTLLSQLIVADLDLNLSPLFQHRTVQKVDFVTADINGTTTPLTVPKLELLLPKLTLADDVIAHLRQRYLSPPTAPPPEAQPQSVEHRAKLTTTPSVPVVNQLATLNETLLDIQTDTAALAALHFELMNQFLASQAHIAEAFFDQNQS